MTTAQENTIAHEEPSIPVGNIWALVVRAHAKYKRKGMPDMRPKEK